MTGENFKFLNRNTQSKSSKVEIIKLKDQCRELYYVCRDAGYFDSTKHDKLSKKNEWLEYLSQGGY